MKQIERAPENVASIFKKKEQAKKEVRVKQVASLALFSHLSHSSTLKMRRHIPPKQRLIVNRLHGVISQKIKLVI
jgi:hypothetical protein